MIVFVPASLLVDLKGNTIEDLDDCLAKSAIDSAHKLLKVSKNKAFEMVNKTVNRDHARTPFQWNSKGNAGFNRGHKTWLMMNSNYTQGVNVEDELNDPNSILNFYKEMIKLRNENDTLKFGKFIKVKSNKNVAKFIRESEDETLLIVVNLTAKVVKDNREEKEVLLANDYEINTKTLKPYQGIIYKIK